MASRFFESWAPSLPFRVIFHSLVAIGSASLERSPEGVPIVECEWPVPRISYPATGV